MKKYQITVFLMALSISTFAQVGINTDVPNATLDITSKATTNAKDGLIPPKLTRQQLAEKVSNTYSTNQIGAIVYITDVTAPTGTTPSLAQTNNITTLGYYFFDGSVWQKISADTTNDAWINDSGKVTLGTKADGTARDAKTDISAYDNGRLGIGTGSVSPDAGLHIRGEGDGWKDDIRLDSYSGDTGTPAANIRFYGAKGTVATPGNLSSGNTIGQINFHGKVGSSATNFPSLARIWSSYEGDGTTEKASLNFSSSGAQNSSLVINADENVGIGTSAPNTTLDIRKKSTNPTTAKDGIIPPVMTKDELANKASGTYGARQTGAIVYVSDTATPTGTKPSESQAINIKAKGYYAFDGTTWNPFYDSNTVSIPIKYGVMTSNPINVNPIADRLTNKALKSYIELPPGKWLVTVNILLYANDALKNATNQPWFWTRFSFNGETTADLAQTSITQTTDFVGGALISGTFSSPPTPSTNGQRPVYLYSLVSGQVIINNTTNNNKFYGLIWRGSETNFTTAQTGYEFINLSSAGNGENIISAMKIQ